MKGNQIFKTSLWLIAIATWIGIIKLIRYKADMYYSKIVPDQMNDDAAYSKLQTHDTVNTIITLLTVLVFILIIFRIYRVWYPKQKVSNPST